METPNSRGQCATELLIAMFVLTAFVFTLHGLSKSTRKVLQSTQLSRGPGR